MSDHELTCSACPSACDGVGFDEALARLEPISLEEVVESADLQVRKDVKYVIRPDELAGILDRLTEVETPRVLEIDGRRLFRYESVYFDSPELTNYFDVAHRRPRRTKVRVRTYVDSGSCMLEVKQRDNRGHTVKHRLPYDRHHARELTREGAGFVAATGTEYGERLQPSLTSSYRRATLLFSQSEVRVTIDVGLVWRDSSGRSLAVPGLVLLETKSLVHPSAVDRVLWGTGHRPSTISKYGTGLAALRPTLPSNKWHRVLTTVIDRSNATAVA
ncbi:MAG: polyphosphate polymerase domain-containing protein [Gemmatimonadaceae bacterium]|nr:polyphosphate polymerase domain-containing protein [Gemmatimonadaceae bacterium]